MTPQELALLQRLEARDANPATRGRFSMRLSGWPGADDAVPQTNVDRTRYIAELRRKLASGWKSESGHVAEAQAQMAANRESFKDELLRRSSGMDAEAHPARGRLMSMIADKAELATRIQRERAEAFAYRAEAAAQAHRRQRLPTAPSQGQLAEAALVKIARVNSNI